LPALGLARTHFGAGIVDGGQRLAVEGRKARVDVLLARAVDAAGEAVLLRGGVDDAKALIALGQDVAVLLERGRECLGRIGLLGMSRRLLNS
jgi:hypothetical protein